MTECRLARTHVRSSQDRAVVLPWQGFPRIFFFVLVLRHYQMASGRTFFSRFLFGGNFPTKNYSADNFPAGILFRWDFFRRSIFGERFSGQHNGRWTAVGHRPTAKMAAPGSNNILQWFWGAAATRLKLFRGWSDSGGLCLPSEKRTLLSRSGFRKRNENKIGSAMVLFFWLLIVKTMICNHLFF